MAYVSLTVVTFRIVHVDGAIYGDMVKDFDVKEEL